MSKSIDNLLKQLLDSQEAQTKAFEEKFTAFANENCSYTERMKKMEDGLTEAMKKVLEMDANIKEYHKAMGGKVEEIEKRYAEMFKPEDENKERKKEEADHEKNETPSIEKKEQENMKDAEKKEKDEEKSKKEHLKEDTEEFNQEKKNLMKKGEEPSEEDEKKHKEDADDEEKEASNQLGGINKNQTVNAPMNQKRHRENPLGKPRSPSADKKLIVDGGEPYGKETIEEAKAEQTAEVAPVAEEAVTAPVASETPSQSILDKVEAALEKLASMTSKKPVASEVAVSEAVALETKAKEEAIAKYKALEEKFESLMAKVSTIEKSASTVETKAAQLVAKQGTEAVAISTEQEVVAETDESIYKQFEALNGVDQRKFYLANKAIIERHASNILRQKR